MIRIGKSIQFKWVKFGLRLLTLIIISTEPMSSPNIFKANSIQNSCPGGRTSETRSALSPCCWYDPSINRYRPFPVITKYIYDCKFGEFYEGFIFGKLALARIPENMTFVNWRIQTAVYCCR